MFPTAALLVAAVEAAGTPSDVAILITDGDRTTMRSVPQFDREALPPLTAPFHPQGRGALAIVDDRLVELAPSPIARSRHAAGSAPGLFRQLVEMNAIAQADVDPLIDLLPADDVWVASAIRNGEAFDSTRWSLAFDAAIARFAAHLLDDETDAIEERVRACAGLDELWCYQRVTFARQFLDSGATPDMLAPLGLEPGVVEEALASPANTAVESELVTIELLAADGAYAFHATRRILPTSEPAVRLVARAMPEYGAWIVAYGMALVEA